VNTEVIRKIEERFGNMMVTRGKEHVFLGMNVTFNDDGTVTIKMKDYVKEAISDFGEDITKSATTPAKRDLFEINEGSKELTIEKSEVFHSVMAKLLYVSKRRRSWTFISHRSQCELCQVILLWRITSSILALDVQFPILALCPLL
jgi:hypothetical protein